MGTSYLVCSALCSLRPGRLAPLVTLPKESVQKRLTWDGASLTFVAQDPVEALCIRRKQGYSPWALMTESPVQVLQAQHQVQTAVPALVQAHLMETLENSAGLLLDLLAWVAEVLFNHFPLLQEDPDFKVCPRARGRTCRDRGTR